MTKTRVDLVTDLMEKTGLKRPDATKAVEGFIDIVKKNLANGETVQIVGFGAFGVKDKPARAGRNPRSGEAIHIPAKRVPYFKAGAALKSAVKEMKVEEA